MPVNSLTREGRVAREQQFHDARYTHDTRDRATKFYVAGNGGSSRYGDLVAEVVAPARVLEFGCGTGSSAFALAERGCDVIGIDISAVAVDQAAVEAAHLGVAGQARFWQRDAENTGLPSRSFDVVCGSGILHHLDLDGAFTELNRVLDDHGCAVFYEPMGHNPLINLYRRLTPNMRTPDEHPLKMDDFVVAQRHFDVVETEFFDLLAPAGAFLARRRGGRRALEVLRRVDRAVLTRMRFLRRFAWTVVVRLEGPRRLN